MSHLANGEPDWTELLPPGRDPAPASGDAPAPEDDGQNEPDDDLFADWEPQRRVNRLTAVLAACVLVAAAFAVGAVVAKRSAPTTAAATGAAARFGAAGGPASREGLGGFAGASGGPGAVPGAGTGGFASGGAGGAPGAPGGGTQAGTGAGDGTAATSETPVVVGTVSTVGANQITVKNFAGASVIVRVPATASVTTRGLSGLKKGQTVSVAGTPASDGSVTATAVVSRS